MTDRERELTGLQLVQLCSKLYAEKADLTMKVEGLEADLSTAADALAEAVAHSERLVESLGEVMEERSILIQFLKAIGARMSVKESPEKPAVDGKIWS
jgi:hypothetical protein